MDNSGKQLERLIQEIEQSLLPKDFEVTLNKPEFNDAGNQIAEFDLVITGRLGSSSIKWLIECRDRPSDGAAPGSWIEQLAGRKRRFNFDKVIAVSTTGFAEGAKEFAEREGIVLRTVRTIAEIGSDFTIQQANYFGRQVTVGPIDAEANPKLANVNILTDAQFKLIHEIGYRNFQNFVLEHIDLDLFQLSGNATFRFEFYCEDSLDVIVNAKHLRIDGLSIPVQLDISVYEGKALAINVYSETDEMIGRDATFGFDLPTGSFTFRVLFLNNFDGTQKITFSPPENVPSGFTVDFLDVFTNGA
jgi:hypothetical protein